MSEALQVIPLSRAVLCIDCDAVSNATGERCPACGSPSLNLLSVWLDRSVATDEKFVVHPMEYASA